MTTNTSTRPDITFQVTRGVRRLLAQRNIDTICELTLKTGRRVDVIGLDEKGKITIIEVKSSKEDFQVDEKWEEYLPFCDQFFFAVNSDFPSEILPEDTGLIIADTYGAEIIRDGTVGDLNPARRKAVSLRFARFAARKSMLQDDPDCLKA